VGVDHGGGHVAVAEELLDGADVGAVFQQVGGEGVAEGVAGGALGDAALRAWFWVDAATLRWMASALRNRVISAAPMSAGWRLSWKRM
jgi:hypothetical protein